MNISAYRCNAAALFFAVCVVGGPGCSKHTGIDRLPAEIKEHAKFADYLSYEKKSGQEYVLAFDANRDSKADTWEYWNLSDTPTLYMATADKDFNGSVDTWIYFNPTNAVYQERDTDGDGKVDRQVLRDGRILALDTNGASWCNVTNSVLYRTK